MKRRQKRMREKAEKDKEKLLKGSAETVGYALTVSRTARLHCATDSRRSTIDASDTPLALFRETVCTCVSLSL
jgi:hypothetical protein